MKLTQKELERLIDNFLAEDRDMLKEHYNKNLLTEQPSGTNTMTGWRYPGVGEECKLNITQLLTKTGLPPKASQNVNDALSFILARFAGLNTWMCDIINIGLGVPRDTGDSSDDSVNADVTLAAYLSSYEKKDWENTYKELGVKDKETFTSNFINKIKKEKENAGITTGKEAKNPNAVATFVEELFKKKGVYGSRVAIFNQHRGDSNNPDEIAKNLRKQEKGNTNFYSAVLNSIQTAVKSSNSEDVLKDMGIDKSVIDPGFESLGQN